jgi:hypothetical protein
MTPADRRISELIDKWLASIDLHLRYVDLTDAAYARAQPWPKHDRPTRWVLEVARQKILELKHHCETRQAMGDSKFAEALELMSFLANLVGIQNIQRFIPIAEAGKEGSVTATTGTIEAPPIIKPAIAQARSAADEPTREMPRVKPAATNAPSAPTPAKVAPSAATPRPVAVPKVTSVQKPVPAQRPVQKAVAKTEAPASVSADVKAKIIGDAVRLLKWGKPWHELAELIGRIADRPPVAEIRKVLRAHKADIESTAAG